VERACPGCGHLREKIGEEIREQLDYFPASLIVREHVRFKYACRACEAHVGIAPVPVQPIEKGLPGPGLLAQVLVGKDADHCPLHRQAGIFQRHGVRISPSTLGDWVREGAALLLPLVQEAKREILGSHVIGSDDTPVPALDRGRDHTRQGRLWVYVGDEAHPYTVYEYSPDRSGRHPQAFLATYRGYLQVDAYAGYDALYRPRPPNGDIAITEVGCMAHCRRGFHEAQASDELRSLIALAQWTALTRYLDDGRLEIDNNRTERALRKGALGRANWTFAGSDAGGERAAVIHSLIESARRHGLDPFAYLRDVLTRVWTHPQSRIAELLPGRWTPAIAP
jgi:transposase